MFEATRTPFASPVTPPPPTGKIIAFPAHAVVRPQPAGATDDPRVRVEYQGRAKVYRDRAHLEAELLGPVAPRDQLHRWGWVAILILCAVAVGIASL